MDRRKKNRLQNSWLKEQHKRPCDKTFSNELTCRSFTFQQNVVSMVLQTCHVLISH